MKTPRTLIKHLREMLARQSALRLPDWPLSAEALIVHALHEATKRPVVWVADGPQSLDTRHGDLLTVSGRDTNQILYVPAWQTFPHQSVSADTEITGRRLAALRTLSTEGAPALCVTSVQALMQRTITPQTLARFLITLKPGSSLDRDELITVLAETGFDIQPQVSIKGQSAVRGGILDVWPVCDDWPTRIDFFGSEVESLRLFNPANQRSLERRDTLEILPVSEWTMVDAGDQTVGAANYWPPETIWVWSDLNSIEDHAAVFMESAIEADAEHLVSQLDDLYASVTSGAATQVYTGIPETDACEAFGDFLPLTTLSDMPREILAPDIMEKARRELLKRLGDLAGKRHTVHLHFDTSGSMERFEQDADAAMLKGLDLTTGGLSTGFVSPQYKLALVAESDLYGRRKEQTRRYDPSRPGSRPVATGPRLDDLSGLEIGDHVVHIDHGIGKYLGMRTVNIHDQPREVIALEYADDALLYIPVTQVHLLSRYVGAGKRYIRRHKLGGKRWSREKEAVQVAVQDLAASLLETQAKRDALPGYAFPPDTAWQRQLEASFPDRETVDQEQAIEDVRSDMEQARPTDRLICGDAGYGKTEVAIRAAFKAVMDAKQVVVLVPTTVLAQQHLDTFRQRMAPFPVRIEMMSRFNTRTQTLKVLEDLAEGLIDIVVGTHGLLQPGVRFKDLGLVIIDEEQRFGVGHKERLKQLRTMVDVLTMTATPIPRTLYLSLSGAKDLSTIETPPQERREVETIVRGYDERLIREAILREVNREGQVYLIHNRVMTIETVHKRLSDLIPEARFAVAHGQMPSGELSKVMHAFVHGETDVLLCTTIVESGVDVPNANTIIIDRADRFGLADLYQLRGRVGRSSRKAYAILLIPGEGRIDSVARKRIQAVRQHSQPGAGFQLALRDLEIRGAGNLLGAEQSGHIAAVGFALYCQLLQRTVRSLKGEDLPPLIDVRLDLDFVHLVPDTDEENTIAIPYDYVEDERLRLDVYRRVAALARTTDIDALRAEFEDRFGPLPTPVEGLLLLARIRIAAHGKHLAGIETRSGKVMCRGYQGYVKDGAQFPRMNGDAVNERLASLLEIVEDLPA